MKGRIELTYELGATIATNNFENVKPKCSATVILENGDGKVDIITEWKRLRDQAHYLIAIDKNKVRAERIQREYENISLIENPANQNHYPRVSDIINPHGFTWMEAAELEQYSARGTIVHHLIAWFLRTGEWLDPREVATLQEMLHVMDKGSKGLRVEDVKYKEFFEKYRKDFEWKNAEIEVRFFNDEYFYTGQPDLARGFYKGRPAIFDYKSGAIDKPKYFKQVAAYYYAVYGNLDGLGVICPLNTSTKAGFSAPIVCNNLGHFFKRFLHDRRNFRKLFDI